MKRMNPNIQLQISWALLWKILAMTAIIGIAFLSIDILVAVLLAIIISSSLDPFVTFLEKRRIPRLLGTLMIYILSLIGLTLFIYIVLPLFLVELNNFVNANISTGATVVGPGGINASIFETFTATINQFIANLSTGTTSLIAVLSQVLGGLVTVGVIVVISFYLTIGRDGVERFLATILPLQYRTPVLSVYERVREKISHWFVGQLFLSLIIGVLTYVGLLVLGVKYAFIIAITAAILELIPYVGPIFSGTLAVLVAVATSGTLAIYTLILFIAIQQLEQHLFVPAVNRYTTDLNPVIIIIALLVGAEVFGILGVILAVPVAVAFQEIVRYWANLKLANQSDSRQKSLNL